MKLDLREVKERGTMEERVVLVAKEDCDIGRYFVFTTRKTTGESFSAAVKNPFWLADKKVSKGDFVVLYTKVGSSSSKINDDKTTSHFYFRNLTSPIYTNGEIVLLVEANTWKVE